MMRGSQMSKKKATENETVVDLIRRAKEEHKKKEKEALKLEQENEKKIIELTKNEIKLREDIQTRKARVAQLEDDYETIENEMILKNLEEVTKGKATKEEVLSGKITAREFFLKGKKDAAIQEEVDAKTLTDMETLSDTIRETKTEIIRLELELASLRRRIFDFAIYPGRVLRNKYKELTKWLDAEIAETIEDINEADTMKIQKQNELNFIERGYSLGSGYKWSELTKRQARALQHNPVLPKKYISFLLAQLAEIEGEDTKINVIYHPPGSYWPGEPLEVQRSFEPGETISTTPMAKRVKE
jgi:hypothetical protein